MQNVNPFDVVFTDFWGRSLIPSIADMCDEAIGVYEHLSAGTGLVPLPQRETIDIVSAIERTLRPAFKAGPPTSEASVQKEVETILNALGVPFTREQDTVPVGAHTFRPDFILPGLDLAIEIKLARGSHSESSIQEELAADILAYRTRWQHLLVVVYDIGVIANPDRLRRANMQNFGVVVLVVKH